ncbi:MAG: AAA family ATPase [Methanotrichaceae archaeon]|nr:AAA family ATPase [Methanotrichaceae archaeon]
MRIIGFVGMPGSGKSVASEVARKMGLTVVVMGDVIRKEAIRLQLEPTDENLGQIGNLLREMEGPTAIAQRTLEMARFLGGDIVIIDGLRSKAEVDFFRSNAEDFKLVEICAPHEARSKRIAIRGRSDDSNFQERNGTCEAKICGDKNNMSFQALERRESREMGWGMHEAIEEADFRVSNDGDIDAFRRSIQQALQYLISKI